MRASWCSSRHTTKLAGCSAFTWDRLSGSSHLLILRPYFFINSKRVSHLWSNRKTILGGLGTLNPYIAPGT